MIFLNLTFQMYVTLLYHSFLFSPIMTINLTKTKIMAKRHDVISQKLKTQ